MKHGKALPEYSDFIMEMFMDGNDYDGVYTAYQFEYPEDEAWCFGASVWEDGGEWVAELDEAYWADEWRATFPTIEEAMEWAASWAWCPEVGQGERTVQKWACPNEECSGHYGERPAILDGDEEHGWTCPKCGCHTSFPEADGCYYLGRE